MKFGLDNFVFAKATKNKTTNKVTYADGFTLPGARSAKFSPTVSNSKYYADNEPWITDNSISEGTLEITCSQLDLQKRAEFYGHNFTAATTGENAAPAQYTIGEFDEPQPMGVGYCVTHKRKVDGVVIVMYTGVWYNFVTFHESDDESKTKEGENEYTDETLSGNVEAVLISAETREIGDKAESTTKADVIAWLNAKAGITA